MCPNACTGCPCGHHNFFDVEAAAERLLEDHPDVLTIDVHHFDGESAHGTYTTVEVERGDWDMLTTPAERSSFLREAIDFAGAIVDYDVHDPLRAAA
jgi:hypothetical protein